jgi:pSer/pThr/pTyr-binding forkhead associated (FHA) protein
MPKFQITLPDNTELSYELTEELVTVGRLSDNAIELVDASVSSHHAEISVRGEDYILRDIGSTNGTRYNGKALPANEDRTLRDGDVVMFGSIRAVYASENPAHAAPMPVEESAAVVTADASIKPQDFVNASPFQTQGKKKAPAGTGILVFGVVAIVAALGVIAAVLSMQAPS